MAKDEQTRLLNGFDAFKNFKFSGFNTGILY